MKIIPPLILSDAGDVDIFESLDQAESYCEPYDINSLVGFDSQGRKLEFEIRKVLRRVLWSDTVVEKVTIGAEEDPQHMEDLQQLLIAYLRRVKTVKRKPFLQRDWSQFSLPELIDWVKNVSSSK